MAEEVFKHILSKEGHTLTVQRRVLLDELNKTEQHLTADEIYLLAKKRLPNISVGTVYRNLGILVKLGMINKLDRGDKPALYEGTKDFHYHLICEQCGKVDNLKGVKIDSLEQEIAELSGYKINSHKLEIYGICPECGTQKVEITEYVGNQKPRTIEVESN